MPPPAKVPPAKRHAALLRPEASMARVPAGPVPVEGSLRPPKAPPPRKASCMAECQRLEQLPNIGPSLAADLRDLGVQQPSQLQGQDPLMLYRQLCQLRGVRQDPCVLDTFMAAVDFAQGGSPKAWWTFTADRKARYGAV